MATVKALPARALYRKCDSKLLSFRTTDDLDDLGQVLGQDRALEAVHFAAGIKRQGYNLFALGPPGTGKHSVVRDFLAKRAEQEDVPPDWCYVNNFTDPQKPRALWMPTGRAAALRDDMRRLVEELRVAIPAMFESEDYRARTRLVEEELKDRQESAFREVESRANERGIGVVRTPAGFALAPMHEGAVLSPKDFNALPEDQRARFQADIEDLQEVLQETLQQFPQWEREARSKIRALNREATQYAVGHLIEELRGRYDDLPEVLFYLDQVREDVIGRAPAFLQGTAEARGPSGEASPGGAQDESLFHLYQVNVVVDHGKASGAPVVYEDHPMLPNLIGRIEHRSQFGALVTDFTLIQSGSLHRANGGYLLLDARRLLTQPLAWDELKRVLRSREIRIESLGQMLSAVSTVSLEPEPIPLDIKVVLFGDRQLYYQLCALDPEFEALFKVPADFDDRTGRDDDAVIAYARQIATLARRESIQPLDRGAVARVIEHSSRLAGDSERLSTRLGGLADLLQEAEYWSQSEGRKVIKAQHVQAAIDAGIRRADRIRERLYEEIDRGTVLLDVAGSQVGQINGLSVLQLNQFAFGKPARITARVRLGRGEVVDIERRVELGGPLHSKGVLILSGYLGAKFAADRPLSLSASLVFEQSYGGVDGDSASSTELYALLSALAEAPIAQSLAVTGSVNQYGEVQAIGGVNEKIEGFFDICSQRGLTGEQGVLIPESNVKHLMLRRDVVDAVRSKRFAVYPVRTIDEGIELLTGVPAGLPAAEGRFPDDTINGRVAARLDAFAAAARRFARGDKKDANNDSTENGA